MLGLTLSPKQRAGHRRRRIPSTGAGMGEVDEGGKGAVDAPWQTEPPTSPQESSLLRLGLNGFASLPPLPFCPLIFSLGGLMKKEAADALRE